MLHLSTQMSWRIVNSKGRKIGIRTTFTPEIRDQGYSKQVVSHDQMQWMNGRSFCGNQHPKNKLHKTFQWRQLGNNSQTIHLYGIISFPLSQIRPWKTTETALTQKRLTYKLEMIKMSKQIILQIMSEWMNKNIKAEFKTS